MIQVQRWVDYPQGDDHRHWIVRVRSPQENATVYFDRFGNIIGADLTNTLRGEPSTF
jgi:hypothetical protein